MKGLRKKKWGKDYVIRKRCKCEKDLQVWWEPFQALLPAGLQAEGFLWFWESFLEDHFTKNNSSWYEFDKCGVPMELKKTERLPVFVRMLQNVDINMWNLVSSCTHV